MSDVKELTPEFFYSPEIFLNSNKLPLGEMQVRACCSNILVLVLARRVEPTGRNLFAALVRFSPKDQFYRIDNCILSTG